MAQATASANGAKTQKIDYATAVAIAASGKIRWSNVEGETARNVAEGSILQASVTGMSKVDSTGRNGEPQTTLYANAKLVDDGRPVKFRVKSEEHLKQLSIGAVATIERMNLPKDEAEGRDRDVAYFSFVSVNLTSSANAAIVAGEKVEAEA